MSGVNDTYKILISRILEGETRLFLILVNDHKRLVSRIVWKMVNKSSEREDICQDVFFKIYKSLAKFKFESKLSTWIAQITYNTCLNYIDKKNPELYEDFLISEEHTDIFRSEESNAIQLLENKDTADRLRNELNRLPEQLRTALALFHLEEMKYEEISTIMGLPLGTVKSHIFRARKILKEKLEQNYKQEELWNEN
ncbi:MAG: sigma-70 family RNA polymerase sigma factor [Deferribacteres bacterium]|nr:sigma-70 family RNA polymerase sigma factor [candidate division KSB1 bacterium]MCB9504364.1 sigma-70 family RNA polymerase sigma factor [Deferribacteres bacterium]